MATLNGEAFRLVRIQEARLVNIARLPRFSIVFMGDTHAGMACQSRTPPLPVSINQYERLLNVIKNVDRNYPNPALRRRTLAIIHGGDGTDEGRDNLIRFINRTVQVLYAQESSDNNRIPLFMNAGNHEYKAIQGGKLVEGVPTGYETLVQANELTKSEPPGQHPDVQVIPLNDLRLRIVLLNTGYGNRGDFNKIDKGKFEREITQIDRWMANLEKQSDKIRFIIDMHIPPQIGRFGSIAPGASPHVLNDQYNALFVKNILDKHKNSITAVVCHHRHCIPLNNAEYPFQISLEKYPRINFFITPAGGNCDIVCGGLCNPAPCDPNKYPFPYHAIKINFQYINEALEIENFEILGL